MLLQTQHDVAHYYDICAGRCALGSFLYRCLPCGFDMHPHCAWLPPCRRTQLTPCPGHDLTLDVTDGHCATCHIGARHEWFYRCVVCNIDFHFSCATGCCGEDNNTGTWREVPHLSESKSTLPPSPHPSLTALSAAAVPTPPPLAPSSAMATASPPPPLQPLLAMASAMPGPSPPMMH
jgi:hypothetical protein